MINNCYKAGNRATPIWLLFVDMLECRDDNEKQYKMELSASTVAFISLSFNGFYSALMESNEATLLSLYVHSILTAQTRLECFSSFIIYMSTISNVKITDYIQFVSCKSHIYTCINIYARTKYFGTAGGCATIN